jgi:epoxyqueuosine reductase QueG
MEEKIRNLIRLFVESYKTKKNTVTDWNSPLVSFADARDPLFSELISLVNVKHKLPTDLLKDARTVISYFVPFKREIVLSNSIGRYSSREWVSAYIETNKLIEDLNDFLSSQLDDSGFSSFIQPPTHNFNIKKLVSDWSHKHVAFIAGLGKFGLHHMLITRKGCCGRLGSLIVNVMIPPTKRPSNEFCLHKNDVECMRCVDKCVFGALKVDSFDRHECYRICRSNGKIFGESDVADVCGKCVCLVPCSFTNPVS